MGKRILVWTSKSTRSKTFFFESDRNMDVFKQGNTLFLPNHSNKLLKSDNSVSCWGDFVSASCATKTPQHRRITWSRDHQRGKLWGDYFAHKPDKIYSNERISSFFLCHIKLRNFLFQTNVLRHNLAKVVEFNLITCTLQWDTLASFLSADQRALIFFSRLSYLIRDKKKEITHSFVWSITAESTLYIIDLHFFFHFYYYEPSLSSSASGMVQM